MKWTLGQIVNPICNLRQISLICVRKADTNPIVGECWPQMTNIPKRAQYTDWTLELSNTPPEKMDNVKYWQFEFQMHEIVEFLIIQ